MVKSFSFVSGGMIVHADKVERSHFGGMCNLITDGVRVASIDFDFSRLKVLHFHKDSEYAYIVYNVSYK